MQGDNHTDVVSEVKRALMVRGVDLAGPCGAFEITRRVAFLLRDEGVGELYKPGGEQCRERATGFLVYRDGSGYDMLGDAGGANIPQWNKDNGPDPNMAARWRAPADPGDTAPPPASGLPPAGEAGAGVDDDVLAGLVESLARIADGVDGLIAGMATLAGRVQSLEENGVRLKLR